MAGPSLGAVELTLERGVDPSRDIPLAGCHCGPDGHRLLRLCLDRQRIAGPQAEAVSNGDLTIAKPTLMRLRQAGVAYLLIGREGGWPASWWTAMATPTGLLHAAMIAGDDAHHGAGCGGDWSVSGRCGRCGTPRPQTIGLARRRLAAMPVGPDRALEAWASQFTCPYHGRARTETVRTDKCCALCREMLVRGSALE